MRRTAFSLTLLLLVVLVGAASSGSATPPPGATARCDDGTYSYSKHHSGTCSHHGGVAAWLGGRSTAPAPTADGGSSGTDVGQTVLLSPRTRTTQCRLGVDPDRSCSPGAYYSKLTRPVICSATFRTSSIRNVPESEKLAVEAEYGMKPGHYGRTLEIDHIVSLELGGSNDIANLYPERAPGYHAKDALENRLHSMVCTGAITLRSAQHRIASNWQALYEKVFGVAPTT